MQDCMSTIVLNYKGKRMHPLLCAAWPFLYWFLDSNKLRQVQRSF